MLTILVPLATAAIAATVAVVLKRVDVRAGVEQSHAQARIEGYERVLTAADAAWYWSVKCALMLPIEDPEEIRDPSERWHREAQGVLEHGIDQLQAHSRDFTAAEAAIAYLIHAAEMRLDDDVIPEHYEQARDLVLDCQRHDTGLSKRLQLGGVKRWPKKLAALRESAKHPEIRADILKAKARDAGVDGFIIADDGTAILEMLERQEKMHESLNQSLGITAARLEKWRTRDLWKLGLFLEDEAKASDGD